MKGNWNWTEVEESGSTLPEGFYVVEITDAREGEPAKSGAETLEIVYDIAEGQYKGQYAGEWGRNNEWAHTDRRYYGTEKTNGMFKGFLKVLEESNEGFKVADFDNDEKKLIGLKYGIGRQKRYYTGNDGEDKTSYEIVRTYPVAKIHQGGMELPEPRDDRESKPSTNEAEQAKIYGDVPF